MGDYPGRRVVNGRVRQGVYPELLGRPGRLAQGRLYPGEQIIDGAVVQDGPAFAAVSQT